MHYTNLIYLQLIITIGSHLPYGSCSQPQKLVNSRTVSTPGRNLYKSDNGLLWVLLPICPPIHQSNIEIIVIYHVEYRCSPS